MEDEPNFKTWSHDDLIKYAESTSRVVRAQYMELEQLRLEVKNLRAANQGDQDDWK
jgi:hypothetical protein